MYVSYLTYPPPAGCPRTYVDSRAHTSNLLIANEAPNVYIIEPHKGVVLGSITTLSLTNSYRDLKNSQLQNAEPSRPEDPIKTLLSDNWDAASAGFTPTFSDERHNP